MKQRPTTNALCYAALATTFPTRAIRRTTNQTAPATTLGSGRRCLPCGPTQKHEGTS